MQMKAKIVAAACVAATLAVLLVGYSSRAEQPVTDPLSRIGVVGVMKVLRESQRQADHEKDLAGEQDKINGELSRLNQEVETEQAKLKTFKAGTPEHLDLYRSMVEKQGKLQALQEYYRQSASLKEKQWTEQFFKEILDATAKIAEQKGLALVLERTEVEFPIPAERFVLALASYKVLYAKGCVDITADVMAAVDKK
jgi:Skp family chaperone for outer membrane proteins